MCTESGTTVTASASANIYDEATLIALDMGDEVQLYHTLVYPLIWHNKWCVATLLGERHLSGHGLDLRTNLIAGGSRVPPRHLPRPERAQLPRLAGRRFGSARAAATYDTPPDFADAVVGASPSPWVQSAGSQRAARGHQQVLWP